MENRTKNHAKISLISSIFFALASTVPAGAQQYSERPTKLITPVGGYQLTVAMDILRGSYREGFNAARPIAANVPLAYQFALPNANYVFKPGHRFMVHVQSSWFPLYDRNPQSFVPNIVFAAPQA